MPIETYFIFGHVVAAATGAAAQDPRGLLAGFVGDLPLAAAGEDNPKRSWSGQGFNLIVAAQFRESIRREKFFSRTELTEENLDFTECAGSGQNIGIADRGALQQDILLGGICIYGKLRIVSAALDSTSSPAFR